MKLRHVFWLISLPVAVFIWGCSSPTGAGGPSEADMVGTWNFTSMFEHAVFQYSGSLTGTMTMDTTVSMVGTSITINGNHTFTSSCAGGTMCPPSSGTWALSGSTLTMYSLSDTTVMTVSVNGKNGTFINHQNETSTEGTVTVTVDLTLTIQGAKL